MPSPKLRAATEYEIKCMINALALSLDDMRDVEEFYQYDFTAWILEDYQTDSPGYTGPIGFIQWPGGPELLTRFIKYGHAWEVINED